MKQLRIKTQEFIFQVDEFGYVICSKNDKEETLLLVYSIECPNIVSTIVGINGEYKDYIMREASFAISEVKKWL